MALQKIVPVHPQTEGHITGLTPSGFSDCIAISLWRLFGSNCDKNPKHLQYTLKTCEMSQIFKLTVDIALSFTPFPSSSVIKCVLPYKFSDWLTWCIFPLIGKQVLSGHHGFVCLFYLLARTFCLRAPSFENSGKNVLLIYL